MVCQLAIIAVLCPWNKSRTTKSLQNRRVKVLPEFPLCLERWFPSLCPITEHGGGCVCERERARGGFFKFVRLLLWKKPPRWFPWPANGPLSHTHTEDTVGWE